MCDACAAAESARRKDSQAAGDHGGIDLLDGRYYVAVPIRH